MKAFAVRLWGWATHSIFCTRAFCLFFLCVPDHQFRNIRRKSNWRWIQLNWTHWRSNSNSKCSLFFEFILNFVFVKVRSTSATDLIVFSTIVINRSSNEQFTIKSQLHTHACFLLIFAVGCHSRIKTKWIKKKREANENKWNE